VTRPITLADTDIRNVTLTGPDIRTTTLERLPAPPVYGDWSLTTSGWGITDWSLEGS
jgi:hypothetical protein